MQPSTPQSGCHFLLIEHQLLHAVSRLDHIQLSKQLQPQCTPARSWHNLAEVTLKLTFCLCAAT